MFKAEVTSTSSKRASLVPALHCCARARDLFLLTNLWMLDTFGLLREPLRHKNDLRSHFCQYEI